MKKSVRARKGKSIVTGLFGMSVSFLLITACHKDGDYSHGDHTGVDLGSFSEVNLVANNGSYHAARIDPALLNAWGIAFTASGGVWITSTGAGVSTVYNSEGIQAIPAVAIPSAVEGVPGTPTGIVANSSADDFILSNGKAAKFLFAGLDGVISGWNGGTTAMVVRNNAGHAIFTGLATATDNGKKFLYAANAQNGGIDVWDNSFKRDTTKPFKDPQLPAGYTPFNIHLADGQLLVAYTKVGPDGRALNEVGNGIVDIFTTGGVFVKRFATGGKLNAPWGITSAPAGFFPGKDAQNAILIGNFRDGKINAYTPNGEFIDQLKTNGKIVVIDGLWEIGFPPSSSTVDPHRLYFAAGPKDEKDGLFGYLVR